MDVSQCLRILTGALASCALAFAGQEQTGSPEAVAATKPEKFGAIDPQVWVTTGSVVPALELPRVDGSGVFDLASLHGKKVLLIQFASW